LLNALGHHARHFCLARATRHSNLGRSATVHAEALSFTEFIMHIEFGV
jgi:hypothetical protein